MRCGHRYNGRWIGTRIRSIEWRNFQRSWVTLYIIDFKVTIFCTSNNSKMVQSKAILTTEDQYNRIWSIDRRHFQWPWTTPNPDSKVTPIFVSEYLSLLLLLVCVTLTITGQPQTAPSSAECSRDKPPFSFVRGQYSTMWDIVWVSPKGHRSVSVSRHFLLQAPRCPCSVGKRFSRDQCYRVSEVETWLPDCGVTQ